ncbi:transglycosylase SLT domain-containing protein [Burkholderia gladioli]|uniref:Transglycosylase SLT domain-containing protein n=1 Tax=Burkholderia gladioli TaxID=28095 RepID=A0AB38U5X9_BURGA|nr:transglycosylase SLT domain-containing protein [Burkholderia gladioli]UWX75377.1 transglycosylase SLT domain-containing protein [Burkholderia gladioli]
MPNGYDPSTFPTSYKDPAYDQADQAASAAVGIPAAWLNSIRTQGEKSNADQISSAQAATPYQITPPTRQAIIKQTGVDPYLNPQNAAYGAAYLLKQNLDRYGGNPVLATAAYHGGTDQSNWGTKTMAYAKRVTGASPNNPDATPSWGSSNPYQVQALPQIGSAPGAIGQPAQPGVGADPYAVQPLPNVGQAPGAVDAGPSALQQAFQAYQSGKMDPADKAQFEQDVSSGRIVLPTGMNVNAPQAAPSTPAVPTAPQAAVDAFNSGKMTPEEARQFQSDVEAGRVQIPAGSGLIVDTSAEGSAPTSSPAARMAGVAGRGYLQGLSDSVGGLVDAGKRVIDAPINAVNSIAQGGGALNAIDSLFGTHLAPTPATNAPLSGAPAASPNIPAVGETATIAMNRAGLPSAQTPAEKLVQAGAQGAGALTVPVPGMSMKAIPTMIAAGAGGGAVGEAVHQATGSPALGMVANLLTTALSPVAASRVMSALAKELPEAATAARVEPTLSAAPGEAAGSQVRPAASAAISESANPPVQPLPSAAAEGELAGASARTGEAQAKAAGAESAPSPEAIPPSAATSEAVPQVTANPSSSPLGSAAQDFMSPDQLAAQTRKATGAQGAPFGIGKQTAQQTLAAQMAPDAERLAAAERLGIADNLQPDHLTTNQAAIELAQAIKSTPGSAARAQEMEGLQQVGQRASQVIDDAGGTRDLSDLSAQVKSEMMNTQQQLDQKGEQLYSELRSMVPPKMSVNPDNVLSFISQRSDELGGAKNLSPVERMIQSKLTPREVPTTINGQQIDPAVLGLKPQTEGPSYALLDDVRKNIGAGLKNQGPFKDADTGLLKALYGRISDDQRAALGNVPGAVEKFDTARAAVQMRKSMEDDLTSLFGKQLGDSLVGKLGTAVSSLNKGDETKLVNLLKAVPSNLRQQVMASGLSYAFGKATRNGELNFKTYADFWDSLMKNSRAANAVLGNLPAESRQQLADLAKVSRGISNATRETITTGRIMAARDSLNGHADGLLRNIYGIARQAAISRIGSAVTGGAAAVGGPIGAGLAHALMSVVSKGKPDVMKAADELISSPEFQRLTREGPNVSPQTIKEIANTPRMRRFYDAAKDMSAPSDPASRARWLQGVVNAANQNTNDRTNR